jgi:glutamate synthase (NADPH/NADH) large chain
MRKCHLNTCPVGVATQDPELRKRFRGKPEYVVNFMRFLAQEVREQMAELGFRRFEEMIGRVERLTVDPAAADPSAVDTAVQQYRARGLDFSRLLEPPAVPPGGSLYCRRPPAGFEPSMDEQLIKQASPALDSGKTVEIQTTIRNSNRTVGATLSAEVCRRYGAGGLKRDTIRIKFSGSAGQSFGAFLSPGITFELSGDANDYLGKGLSGGRIVVRPPAGSAFIPERNIITGNVNLFGATSGEAFINGMAGERFAVRNSGALAVVEGVGDHGCEYMTGGRVIVIGDTGINFAAGMSGGIAYVLDRNQLFDTRCNLEMVDVEPLVEEEDRAFLRKVLDLHVKETGSRNAIQILNMWEEMLPLFVKVIPIDYRAALKRIKERETRESETVNMTEEVYA